MKMEIKSSDEMTIYAILKQSTTIYITCRKSIGMLTLTVCYQEILHLAKMPCNLARNLYMQKSPQLCLIPFFVSSAHTCACHTHRSLSKKTTQSSDKILLKIWQKNKEHFKYISQSQRTYTNLYDNHSRKICRHE